MALMEIDQAALPADLWKKITNGDPEARIEAMHILDEVHLYLHAMPVKEDWVIITLRDLERFNIVESVKIFV